MSDLVPWGSEGPTGTWKVEGTTSEGESYRGELRIRRVNGTGDALSASWQTSIGDFTGLGLLYNGQLLLSRIPGVVQPGKEPGIVWYTMSGSGDFDAVWSSGPSNGRIGSGFAYGGTPGRLTGRRKILYFDSNGNALPPALDLEIDSEGMAFRLTWKDGAQTRYDGVGLATARGLCSAWSLSKLDAVKTLLVFAARSPREAEGTSATQGQNCFGEEMLWRVDDSPAKAVEDGAGP